MYTFVPWRLNLANAYGAFAPSLGALFWLQIRDLKLCCSALP